MQKNHIYTSGASGTNAAVIRGALRAEKPELLTVILPQSLKKQPPESQELLSKVSLIGYKHIYSRVRACICVLFDWLIQVSVLSYLKWLRGAFVAQS